MVWGSIAADVLAEATTAHTCGARNVSVFSKDQSDISICCEGANDAIGFLAKAGLDIPIDITIEVVPKVNKHLSASAAGCYLESGKKVVILTYSEFEKFGDWFNIPTDRLLYRSLVAHEVAHAIAACNFKISKPSIQAKEYIAYVTQFSTMDTIQRESALTRFPGKGFDSDWQMNATIYLFDPMWFGVQAYRHFLKPENGQTYLHEILSGKALAD